MPRYYFDIHDGINIIDNAGQELPDLNAVRREAAVALAEVAADEPPGNGPEKHFNVVVRETGAGVLQARLSFTAEPKF